MAPLRDELEARLRPGGFSQLGFLGPGERFEEVVARDAARLAQLGVSYDDLAGRLEAVLERGEENRGRWVRAEGRLLVHVRVWKGFQLCPWSVDPQGGQCTADHGGVRFASLDWRIRKNLWGRAVGGPGLIVHLIRAHRFFEGIASPYRVDPEALCALFGLGGSFAGSGGK
jgi:hypothetical protein